MEARNKELWEAVIAHCSVHLFQMLAVHVHPVLVLAPNCPCRPSAPLLTLQVLLSACLHSCRLVASIHKHHIAEVQHGSNSAEHRVLQGSAEQAYI